MLLADNKLDLLHTVLSKYLKFVLEEGFLDKCFIHQLVCICCSPDSPASFHSLCFSKPNLNNNNNNNKPPFFCLNLSFLSPILATDISHSHFCIIFFVSVHFACIYVLPCFIHTFRLMHTAVFFKQHLKAFLILLNV